ncbi:MAG: DUF294 nucleotidyltransferase-like domain-containing protein [Aquincola tertiaricarbonis]
MSSSTDAASGGPPSTPAPGSGPALAQAMARATTLGELAQAAADIDLLVERLHDAGQPVGGIALQVQALSARLFDRAWRLIAPDALVDHSCLFVMGSEGRGEQLLKTDQDNGLLLADGWPAPDDLPALCQRFSDALADFGYPPCPGRIMLSDAQWRGPAAAFSQTVRGWLLHPTPAHVMTLAIFLDAQAVSGDARLLQPVRDAAFELATGNDVLLAHFAAAVHAFGDARGGLLRRLGRGTLPPLLDVKKAGSFPIVHGVRALALAHQVTATGTAERIQSLVAAHHLAPDSGAALVDSLHLFMSLRLDAGLRARRSGQAYAGVPTAALTPQQQHRLVQALEEVGRFKAMLTQRFRLELV